MKTFALILLCAFAAVQGRSAAVKSTRSLAALGENPWVVHLRTAVSTSGLLNSCAGSLIDNLWVLTTSTCLRDVRFIWVRYGAVDVYSPELVTENSAVRRHPEQDLALIFINRYVTSTNNIAPTALAARDSKLSASGTFCGYGANSAGGPGENLSCYEVSLSQDHGIIVGQSEDGEATEYDIGAPLVADGVQIGVLVSGADDDSVAKFIPVADYLDWIESETGLPLSGKTGNYAVNFIN